MTEQPDLPPELLERLCMKLCRSGRSLCVGFCHSRRCRDAIDQFSDQVRAVAPMLIAHGRELEKAEVVAWLREDADKTEQEAAHIVANTTGNPRRNAAEWALLVRLKRGIANAIQRNQHRSKP